MPGLGFSSNGARLGRGKGYYDKYLTRIKTTGVTCKTMALLFNEQLIENIPYESHDVFVDKLIYPSLDEIKA